MAKSSVSRDKNKPQKPYPEFPLYAHATGRWAKKIRGKLHYFGRWDDPDDALQRYLDQRDDLHAGRTPRVKTDGLTIRDLCNRFLTSKRHLLENHEITDRTFRDYYVTCERLIEVYGRNRLVDDLASEDFDRLRAELAKTRGPVALGNEIGRIRVVFKYAFDASLIDRPVRYGTVFKKPSKKTLRIARIANGKRMFEANELRRIIDIAQQPLKAMVFLGINCAFGQTDVSTLPNSVIDLSGGWIEHPRSKTGIERRCQIWPETIEALREASKQRPSPKKEADVDLCFITKYGNRWVRTTESEDERKSGISIDSVAQEFAKLLNRLNIKRNRLNFYALRHTFETIGGESRDQVAVNSLMGHVDNTMAGVYRERISDERLVAVTDGVRKWLFGDQR